MSRPILLRPGRGATRQRAKSIEIHRLLALEDQVRVQKIRVTEFIERVAGKVLRTVAIEILQRKLVGILRSLGNTS